MDNVPTTFYTGAPLTPIHQPFYNDIPNPHTTRVEYIVIFYRERKKRSKCMRIRVCLFVCLFFFKKKKKVMCFVCLSILCYIHPLNL
jgi:hypothetical protein